MRRQYQELSIMQAKIEKLYQNAQLKDYVFPRRLTYDQEDDDDSANHQQHDQKSPKFQRISIKPGRFLVNGSAKNIRHPSNRSIISPFSKASFCSKSTQSSKLQIGENQYLLPNNYKNFEFASHKDIVPQSQSFKVPEPKRQFKQFWERSFLNGLHPEYLDSTSKQKSIEVMKNKFQTPKESVQRFLHNSQKNDSATILHKQRVSEALSKIKMKTELSIHNPSNEKKSINSIMSPIVTKKQNFIFQIGMKLEDA